MAYTTKTDVRTVLAPSNDTVGTAATLPDADIDAAIAEAQDEVDGRIRGQPYPDNDVPDVIRTVTRDIAAFLATLTYRRGDPLDARDPVQLRYTRAQALLADIAAGRIDIPVNAPSDQAAAPVEATVVNPYDGDMFTLDEALIGRQAVPPWRYPRRQW